MNSANPGVGLVLFLVVFVLIVLGSVWKPAIALVIAGMLSIVGGVLATVLGGLFGPSVGINAVIGGIVLIGLGQMVTIAEDAVAELRGLRRDLRVTRPAHKSPAEGPTTGPRAIVAVPAGRQQNSTRK